MEYSRIIYRLLFLYFIQNNHLKIANWISTRATTLDWQLQCNKANEEKHEVR